MSTDDFVYDSSLGATTTDTSLEPGEFQEGTEMAASSAVEYLPGEDAPLPARRGGKPVTPEEALGTARRMAREQAVRRGVEPELPEVLPFPSESGTTPLLSIRVPRRKLWFAHAKADMEGRTVSDATREFLDLYGSTPPGWVMTFAPPTSKRKG